MTPSARPARPRDPMPTWVPKAILMLVGAALLGVAVYWIVGQLQSLLVTLLMSLFISFAIEPAVNFLNNKGMGRALATLLVFFGLFIAIAVFTAAIASVVSNEIRGLVEAVPSYLATAEEWLNDTFNIDIDTSELADQFTEGGQASSVLGSLASNLVGVGSRLVGLLIQVLTVVLFTFYLVADGPRLRRTICSVLNPRRQAAMLRGWEIAIEKTGGYIYSRTLLAIISATFHWLLFWLLGVPYPAPMALWVGVISQFVPVVGTYLAGILPALVALLDEPISALWVVVVVLVYQQVENYLLAPYLTARTMEIHAAVAFGAVLVGTALFGGAGALLAVPAAATGQAIVSTYVKRHELIESELLTGSDNDDDDDDEADGKADRSDDETAAAAPDDDSGTSQA